jgi:hypothetical protein
MSDYKQLFNNILKIYLDNLNGNNLELESRFGYNKKIYNITRLNHHNVIQRLLSNKFVLSNTEYHLRINSNYIDNRTGAFKMSNIRAEINGIHNISYYCKTNTIVKDDNLICNFVKKSSFKLNEEYISPVNIAEYNLKIALNNEYNLSGHSPIVKNILNNWNDNKKTFRYIKRYTYTHQDYPFNIDISIVKESSKKNYKYNPTLTIQESNVLDNNEKYEIEIEVDNKKVGLNTLFSNFNLLGNAFRNVIRIILSGLQETNYPITYNKQNDILQQYMKLLWKEKHNPKQYITPKNFVGPSSYTLDIINIIQDNTNSNIPNIRINYTVTDKADGMRKLLFISNDGGIYLIDTNMKVQFTGSITKNVKLFHTIIDGEHILHDKNGGFINLFACFDVYYLNGNDIRSYGFVPNDMDDVNQFRLPILINIISNLNIIGVNNKSNIRIEHKTFYSYSETSDIFDSCKKILLKEKDGLFEYNTDGIIFTPGRMGVGSNQIGKTTPPLKKTWEHSFKWKPPEFNSIDFLISTVKNSDNTDVIHNIFNNGVDLSSDKQIVQYKSLILRVGFNEQVHGYINPCQNIFDDELPVYTMDDSSNYKPIQFFPTNPTDNEAGLCNILLSKQSNGSNLMLAEEGDIIEDNTIVEFKYISTNDKLWRWSPIRVRYDKTADFRSGRNNFGNAYHVANNNWKTIHNPITYEMITTGLNIPVDYGDDDVYYNRIVNTTNTRALRDFHNLYIKKKLITGVSKRNDTLIDYAVGKGGDFSKWIESNLKFVFGIDISKDNIENRLDGACARYLNYRKKFKVVPDALFVNGNSSMNIKNNDALYTPKNKLITNAIIGKGAKDITTLGKGVYKNFGIAENGFNISSIQFAIHYMFENNITLNNFIRNVSENTMVSGYFIGTCYDGKLLFDKLKLKKQDEFISINNNGNLLWKVTKKYDHNIFNDDNSSLGYAIDVYQESINKNIREYLVNFNYFDRILEDYGFIKLNSDELKALGFNSSSSNFKSLFNDMINETKQNTKKRNNYGKAINMNAFEKQISFLNKYFIYKKVRNVDTNEVFNNLTSTSDNINSVEQKISQISSEIVSVKKYKIKKLKKKIILKN